MELRRGKTAGGASFDVPRTPDMLETLLAPRRWGAAELASAILLLTTGAGILLRRSIPLAVYVVVFAFWRAMYNGGLGAILCAQGERGSFTRAVSAASPSTRGLLNWVATRALPARHDWAHAPAELNSWLAFRALALVVLTADGASYIALAFKCAHEAAPAPLVVHILCAVAGVALCVFSVWAKLEAHHALGDYAWYWGDFFFVSRTQLELSGVFRLAPHPMYTLGYSAYYGAVVLSRSHLLLIISLFAHAAQMAFLLFVEEPHMERIYGTPPATAKGGKTNSQVDEITPAPPSATLISPISALLMSPYLAPWAASATVAALLLLARPPIWGIVVLVVIWRSLHFGALGWVLARQSASKAWTERFARSGVDENAAFQVWRSLYMLSYALNHVLFICLALRVQSPTDSSLVRGASRFTTASVLLVLALAATHSAFEVLGDFGFAYGDFFLPLDEASRNPRYEGVYRYLGHPLCALEYLAYYAMAVWRRSWPLAVLAALIQLANFAFVRLVELPHMRETYMDMRDHSELYQLFAGSMKRIAKLLPFASRFAPRARQLWQTAGHKAYDRCAAAHASATCTVENGVETARGKLGRHKLVKVGSLVTELVKTILSKLDSKKLVAWLRMVGVRIEPIAEAKGKEASVHPLKHE